MLPFTSSSRHSVAEGLALNPIVESTMTADEWICYLNEPEEGDRLRWRYLEEPDDVWFEVLCRAPELKRSLALHKRLGPAVLLKLAQDEDVDTRFLVAMKRGLDAKVFDQLAKDSEPQVRRRVAMNPTARLSVLKVLSQDPDPEVRSAADRRLENHRE